MTEEVNKALTSPDHNALKDPSSLYAAVAVQIMVREFIALREQVKAAFDPEIPEESREIFRLRLMEYAEKATDADRRDGAMDT